MKVLVILGIALYVVCFFLVSHLIVNEIKPVMLDKQEKLYVAMALILAPLTVFLIVIYVFVSIICETIMFFINH